MPVTPNVSRDRVTAAILAGGQSARFGSDKALALVPGTDTTFLERAVVIGQSVAERVLIIGPERPGIATAAAQVVPDRFPGHGPVGGLVTALDVISTEYLVILSCDQPWVTDADVQLLLAGLAKNPASTFADHERTFHPLPCALNVALCRSIVRTAFAEGARSLTSVLQQTSARMIRMPDSDDGRNRLLDIDTREELRRVSQVDQSRR